MATSTTMSAFNSHKGEFDTSPHIRHIVIGTAALLARLSPQGCHIIGKCCPCSSRETNFGEYNSKRSCDGQNLRAVLFPFCCALLSTLLWNRHYFAMGKHRTSQKKVITGKVTSPDWRSWAWWRVSYTMNVIFHKFLVIHD